MTAVVDLPPKTRPMTRPEYVALMASGAWTWRCADEHERAHPEWRLVELDPAKPMIFLRVPETETTR